VAVLGTVAAPVTDEDDANWDCTLIGSGNNVVVRVTGRDNEDITWHLLRCDVGSWRLAAAASNEYQDNLVAYWKLEEAPGTTRVDSAGGRHLTDYNAVGRTGGKFAGSAASFDPAYRQYLSVASDSALQLDNATDWYWCAWVFCQKPIPAYSVILAKRYYSTTEYQLFVASDGTLAGILGAAGSLVTAAKPGLTEENWHFVEFWHVAAAKLLFVDYDRSGAPGTVSTATAGLKSTNPLFIGQDNYSYPDINYSNFFKGYIDEIGLYSYVPPDAIRDGLYSGISPF
jgi:hypothetical protein